MTDFKVMERGEASFEVELSDGVISVRHGTDDGALLAQWIAKSGDWNKLWDCIRELEASGEHEPSIVDDFMARSMS